MFSLLLSALPITGESNKFLIFALILFVVAIIAVIIRKFLSKH